MTWCANSHFPLRPPRFQKYPMRIPGHAGTQPTNMVLETLLSSQIFTTLVRPSHLISTHANLPSELSGRAKEG